MQQETTIKQEKEQNKQEKTKKQAHKQNEQKSTNESTITQAIKRHEQNNTRTKTAKQPTQEAITGSQGTDSTESNTHIAWELDEFMTIPDSPQEMGTTHHFETANPTQLEAHQQMDADIRLHNAVWEQGYPNRFGARIPIKQRWNLSEFEDLLKDYEDIEVVEWLKFGWPSGRLPTMKEPTRSFKNHKGAIDYPEALQKYIQKEQKKDAVMGPF